MIAPWHKAPWNGDADKYHADMRAKDHKWTDEECAQMGEELHRMLVENWEWRERVNALPPKERKAEYLKLAQKLAAEGAKMRGPGHPEPKCRRDFIIE